MEDRKSKLAKVTGAEDRREKIREYLEREVRPRIPARLRGQKISKLEREKILGIGLHGYLES